MKFIIQQIHANSGCTPLNCLLQMIPIALLSTIKTCEQLDKICKNHIGKTISIAS
jgi:hypothetical protein